MNKLTKNLAAIGAAMMMAVSVMSIGASAYSWDLSYAPAPGQPSYIPVEDSYISSYHTTQQSKTRCKSICSSFSSTEDPYGDIAYVKYKIKIYNSSKTLLSESSYHYHRQTNSPNGTTFSLSQTFDYGKYARAFYYLKEDNNYGITASMAGTYSFLT